MQISGSNLLASQQSAIAAGRPHQAQALQRTPQTGPAAPPPTAAGGPASLPQHSVTPQDVKAIRPGGLIDIKV